jgi:hypothetical protein
VVGEGDESVEEGVGLGEEGHKTPRPRRPQSWGVELVESDGDGVGSEEEGDDVGSEGEGGGEEDGTESDGDVTDDGGGSDDEGLGVGLDGVGVGVGVSDEGEGVSEEGEAAGPRIVVTPLTTTVIRPSGDCSRTDTELPALIKSSTTERRRRATAGDKYVSSNLLL